MASKNDIYLCVLQPTEKKFRHTIIFEGDEIIGGTHAEEIRHNHRHCLHQHHDSRSFQDAPAEFNKQNFCKYKTVQSPNSVNQVPELL